MPKNRVEAIRLLKGRCPECDELPNMHRGEVLPCKLTIEEVWQRIEAFREQTARNWLGKDLIPPDRTPLGVVVVIAGERPHQVETWKDALDFIAGFARGDDPVQVSMFTLYWPAPGEED